MSATIRPMNGALTGISTRSYHPQFSNKPTMSTKDAMQQQHRDVAFKDSWLAINKRLLNGARILRSK